MNFPCLVLFSSVLILAVLATSYGQDSVADSHSQSEVDWAINARFLIGLSFPRVKASGGSYDNSSISSQVSNYVATGSISGRGGGWDADDMTWAYLIDATLHRGLGRDWYLGATLGFDRLGKVAHTQIDDESYSRLYAYYLKFGPQLAYMQNGSAIYVGLNGGVPLQVRLSGDNGSIPYRRQGATWNTLWELQSGLRLYRFGLFGGQVIFNIDICYAFTPMLTNAEGTGLYKMFALRTGFSFYTPLGE